MSGRCVELREMSPGGREMPTSGGEREKRRAWTHDITPPPPLKERLSDVPERPTRREGADNRHGSTWHQQQTTSHVLNTQRHLVASPGTPDGL